jgi:uncharacterized protein YcnI
MSRIAKAVIAGSAAAALALAPLAAQAHVSIRPGLVINTDGTVTAATSVTHGKSGYLYFRPGHGCAGSAQEGNPATGLLLSNSKFPTHAFSVTVPSQALGTGANATVLATKPAAPKAQYIPGWKSTAIYNSTDKSWTITWTAIASAYDIPDASGNEDTSDTDSAGNVFAEFGVSVKWNSDSNTGSAINFPAKQVCSVPKSAASATKVTRTGAAAARSFTIAANKKNKNVAVDLSIVSKTGDNIGTAPADKAETTSPAAFQNVKLSATGAKKFTLSAADSAKANVAGALIVIKRHSDGKVLGYYGGTTKARTLVINWNGTNPATTGYVDGVWTEASAAPSVTVQ